MQTFPEIQEKLDLIVFFQLDNFRWKRALSSTTFGCERTGLDVWMNLRLPTSSVSSRRSSQRAGVYLYITQIRSCELYTRGRRQQTAESEASEPGWFPTSEESHLHK